MCMDMYTHVVSRSQTLTPRRGCARLTHTHARAHTYVHERITLWGERERGNVVGAVSSHRFVTDVHTVRSRAVFTDLSSNPHLAGLTRIGLIKPADPCRLLKNPHLSTSHPSLCFCVYTVRPCSSLFPTAPTTAPIVTTGSDY